MNFVVSAFAFPPPYGFLADNPSNYGGRVPDHLGNGGHLRPSIDNLEYILTSNTSNSARGDYHTLGMYIFSEQIMYYSLQITYYIHTN